MSEDADEIRHGDLVLDEIRENPAGRDDRHLDEEYVAFRNDGATEMDLSGWTVENEAGDRFRFPDGTVLRAGRRLTLHSGRGDDTETDLHWGADRPRWRNAGDTVVVRDGEGRIRIRDSYNE